MNRNYSPTIDSPLKCVNEEQVIFVVKDGENRKIPATKLCSGDFYLLISYQLAI